MDVNVSKKENSTIELEITVTEEELAPHRKEAINQLNQNLELPGFRKGKAPISMAEKNMDPAKILEATVNRAIPQLYGKAVKENSLEPIGSPQIEITKFAPGNPLEFKATVAVMPEFKLPDYKKTTAKKKEVKVEDEQVDKLVKRLQRDHAVEKPVDRPAKKGDSVEIDFDITQNKVPIESGQGRQHPLVIGDGMFIPGFEKEIEGLKKDEEKTFSLTFPADYKAKVLAGKAADFKVKMLSIKEREMPKLDDAFAKQVGKFKDMTDLRAQLRDNLKKDEEFKEEQRYESELLSNLAENTEIAIPDVLLQGELDKMARELERSLSTQGAKFDDYLKSINKSLEQLKQGWVGQAKKRVKIGLILRKIGQEEKIDVSDKDIEEEINISLSQNPGNAEVEKTVKSEAYKDYVTEVIRNRKIIKLLSSSSGE